VKDGKVYIVKTAFVFGDEFEKALKNNAKLQQEKEVYVHADQELPYGVVVKVMAALSRNGGEKIGLVTDPLK
jgi:biopolymer transport protein TolR